MSESLIGSQNKNEQNKVKLTNKNTEVKIFHKGEVITRQTIYIYQNTKEQKWIQFLDLLSIYPVAFFQNQAKQHIYK